MADLKYNVGNNNMIFRPTKQNYILIVNKHVSVENIAKFFPSISYSEFEKIITMFGNINKTYVNFYGIENIESFIMVLKLMQ